MEKYTDADAVHNVGKEEARKRAQTFFANNTQQLEAFQKKMRMLQKKYSALPNSNDLSTAVKRNSLEGKPLRERLLIGGNFQVTSLNPFSLDASPQVGYKFNKKLVVGVGGALRHTFSNDPISTTTDIPNNSYGYKAFVSYDIISSFFAYGEYERMSKEIADNNDLSATKIQWIDGLLLGAGRRFTVLPKIDMTVIILYNFLHDPRKAVHPQPWQVKVGFQLSELALIKK
ncbi:porin family protein [Fulvivirga ligni]|uniref:porin family protein n=1 Tax=Fulvivirga ligni TaxID=2904246 RepID=UPI001F2CB21F|nr:porin family protein [Fulvivirga ligni]UII22649.1 porin family protein [Fulvivirga ligni]